MRLFALATVLVGSLAATTTRWTRDDAAPVLRPGAPELQGRRIGPRCDSMWYLSKAPGPDQREQAILAQRSEDVVTTYQGTPALLLVTRSELGGELHVDSAMVHRDGLAPIWETSTAGTTVTRYDYEGARVRLSITRAGRPPEAKVHRYPMPVFNFEELDVLLRSLPLKVGYEALLPLYSEGDDALEVDSVRVEAVDANGVMRLRFADPAVIASVSVDSASRALRAYSHVFRRTEARWTAGTRWQRVSTPCAGASAR